MVKKYIIIVNPTAGNGGATRKVSVIGNFFKSKNLPFELLLTQHCGHAATLAAEYGKQNGVAVVAAGGDGTCNEVINGLMELGKSRRPLFGVLPVGRGNDFSYGVGVPRDLTEALEFITGENSEKLDIGQVIGGNFPQGKYFGNGIGIGFDTIVGLEAAKMKHLNGAMGYVAGALKTFIKFPEAPKIEITYNNMTNTLQAIQISIMNGKRMGGTFFMAPGSDYGDGLFNLCMSGKITRRQMIKTIARYTRGTQSELPNITTATSPEFNIKALEGHLICHADGETICIEGRELHVTMHEGALEILNGK